METETENANSYLPALMFHSLISKMKINVFCTAKKGIYRFASINIL